MRVSVSHAVTQNTPVRYSKDRFSDLENCKFLFTIIIIINIITEFHEAIELAGN